jgi:hypothetical protein
MVGMSCSETGGNEQVVSRGRFRSGELSQACGKRERFSTKSNKQTLQYPLKQVTTPVR